MCTQISTQIKYICRLKNKHLSRKAFPPVYCTFISLYALPPQLLSYLSLLFSHQLCITTFCYNLSDYIRALQWEAARKGEMQKSEGCCAILLSILYTSIFIYFHCYTNLMLSVTVHTVRRVIQSSKFIQL